MNATKISILVLLALTGFLMLSIMFTVDERELAIKFRLGEIEIGRASCRERV